MFGRNCMIIGKIVASESHISYVGQIFGPGEVEAPPASCDYAFGRFVCCPIHHGNPPGTVSSADAAPAPGSPERVSTSVIGVIYDTRLLNPAFGTLGPRLSTEAQTTLFTPDYIAETTVLVSVITLGIMELCLEPNPVSRPDVVSITQGIPAPALGLGSLLETMSDEDVRAFHYFGQPGEAPRLHLEYLPHVIAQRHSLLGLLALNIIDQLERLFADQATILSIIKRNFAWRLKIESTR